MDVEIGRAAADPARPHIGHDLAQGTHRVGRLPRIAHLEDDGVFARRNADDRDIARAHARANLILDIDQALAHDGGHIHLKQ